MLKSSVSSFEDYAKDYNKKIEEHREYEKKINKIKENIRGINESKSKTFEEKKELIEEREFELEKKLTREKN